MKMENGTWKTYGSKIREAEQTPEVFDAGLISSQDVEEATALRTLRHSRTTITSSEVFRVSREDLNHQQLQYWSQKPHDIMMWETVHIL